MGFGARDFIHGANTANPKKLRLPMVNEPKIHFPRETNIMILKDIEKYMSRNPPEARLTDTLRLSGSEPNRAQKKTQKTACRG